MRILIVSDIHANLTALQAVIDDAGEIDAAWCLGDLVGYGPDPNECVVKIRELPNYVCIMGNHDAAVLDQIDSESFNPEARSAIDWTRNQLWEGTIEFLQTLPEMLEMDSVTLTHGSPRFPIWEYLLDSRSATHNFDHFNTPYCFVGHTHLPILYTLAEDHHIARMTVPTPNNRLELTTRSILNPGSVGQPRDRDPRAAYAIYDSEEHTWDYRRVEYDVIDVQRRMTKAGLPSRHIQRLEGGW
jgi:diadenosine tetraphosphatase ApaH/serine/threonine PP2A family protein phosphatase